MAVWTFIAVFATALGFTVALTPVSIWLGKRLDIVDRPGGRRKHHGNVVRIGGLAFSPPWRWPRVATGVGRTPARPAGANAPDRRPRGHRHHLGDGLLDTATAQAGLAVCGHVVGRIVVSVQGVHRLFNSPFTGTQVKSEWY